jgi:hypothetical protein
MNMGKKIFGLLAIGLVVALLIPIGSAYACYDCEFTAIGMIRVDRTNHVIKGFVLYGNNDGDILRFTFVTIKYDAARTPLKLDTAMPLLVYHIEYNPAK